MDNSGQYWINILDNVNTLGDDNYSCNWTINNIVTIPGQYNNGLKLDGISSGLMSNYCINNPAMPNIDD